MKKAKGKLIVIDGTDGSGKATQVKLLVERLKRQKVPVKAIDFPRYYDNFFGRLIGECLAGIHGDFIAVDPKIASVLYAADRWESSKDIKDWIDKGYVVIVDRYASSSQIHQGGKIHNAKERKEFLGWLDQLEYKTFKIPKPNAIIFLDVPIKVTQELLKAKTLASKKKYLEGKGDQAENDPKHLEQARKSAQKMVAESNNWYRVDCAPQGALLSREEINDMIYKEVKKILK